MVRRPMKRTAAAGLVLSSWLVLAGPAGAQSATPGGMPPPPGMTLAQSMAMRFPQPVRAGDLIGRDVLRPVESQDIIGRVRALVRDPGGKVLVIIDFGGFLGFGARPIAVPVDAMVLLGADMEVDAYTPEQLRQFPTFSSAGTSEVAKDTILRIGLAKPSH